ncbi:hypothetical protein F8388_009411 [Cannabis sativa]|uniref:Non-haem dioxygenase N-terminal domain-containing protein n=1 Tax=Cannabis sativa TaxID=3483 RepID=A0A7J6EI59_CANSA|nr:hypothetical protein F8388_009411 [Cannabis sativa]KAF4387144.1 hypothetical protein G4B88_024716 [Cannabis sativa]
MLSSNRTCSILDYEERAKEVEEFTKTKLGVKGLVDSGIQKIPKFFIFSQDFLNNSPTKSTVNDFKVPVIDLGAIFGGGGRPRAELVNQIRVAAETWGFFQMVNHGVPKKVMDDLMMSTRKFHEQNKEEKMKWYSQDVSKLIRFYSYGYLHNISAPANWRDSLACNFQDSDLQQQILPQLCRDEIIEYTKCIITNGRFKSVEHRVLAAGGGGPENGPRTGPRISAACFFYPSIPNIAKPYGPIKELLSHTNPPLYKEVHFKEYTTLYVSKGLDGTSAIPHFQL